jgi:Tol biopolymer transport system component
VAHLADSGGGWQPARCFGCGDTNQRSLIRSTGRESSPSYSPDGKRIANVSGQTQSEEIFLQDSDGKNRVQLTHLNKVRMGRPRWSPDGKQLVFSLGTERGSDVYLIGAVAGAQPARIVPNGNEPAFSQTGKSIYYTARGQLWKSDLNGANAKELTRIGASQPVESADGKYVIFRARRSFYRVPVEGGDEEEFFIPEHEVFWTTIQPVKRGVYYMEWQRSSRGMVVAFYDYATKKNSVVYNVGDFDSSRGAFSISPDEKYILFPRTDRSQTELMMSDGFK